VILHYFPVAPNPTKVRLYIAEKEAGGVSLGIEEALVNLPGGEQHSPEFLARSPLGKLPVLELDDGSENEQRFEPFYVFHRFVLHPVVANSSGSATSECSFRPLVASTRLGRHWGCRLRRKSPRTPEKLYSSRCSC